MEFLIFYGVAAAVTFVVMLTLNLITNRRNYESAADVGWDAVLALVEGIVWFGTLGFGLVVLFFYARGFLPARRPRA